MMGIWHVYTQRLVNPNPKPYNPEPKLVGEVFEKYGSANSVELGPSFAMQTLEAAFDTIGAPHAKLISGPPESM